MAFAIVYYNLDEVIPAFFQNFELDTLDCQLFFIIFIVVFIQFINCFGNIFDICVCTNLYSEREQTSGTCLVNVLRFSREEALNKSPVEVLASK